MCIRDSVQRLHLGRIIGFLFAVMHLTAGVGPFVNLLSVRVAVQYREQRRYDAQKSPLFGLHGEPRRPGLLESRTLFRPQSEGAFLDILLILKALILGLVEAASEFLPISSTDR